MFMIIILRNTFLIQMAETALFYSAAIWSHSFVSPATKKLQILTKYKSYFFKEYFNKIQLFFYRMLVKNACQDRRQKDGQFFIKLKYTLGTPSSDFNSWLIRKFIPNCFMLNIQESKLVITLRHTPSPPTHLHHQLCNHKNI